ncbi:MAG TPA: hypothetical protein VEI49_13385, partial [Terriglobales bacterium]|nr:hypothetical protein [Terriglobales bacterium]
KSVAEDKDLSTLLAEQPEVKSRLNPSVLNQLQIPEQYLGSAEAFREFLLNSTTSNKGKH